LNDAAYRQILAIFREEAGENIDELRTVFERLETAQPAEATEHADAAMRLAHNLKGASATVGEDALARLAHALEDALEHLRDGKLEIRSEVIAAAAPAIAVMQRILDGREHNVSEHERALRALIGAAAVDPDTAVVAEGAEQAGDEVVAHVASDPRKQHTIRVDVRRLDDLLQYTGELIGMAAQLAAKAQRAEAFHGAFLDEFDELGPEARSRSGHLADASEELLNAEREALQRFARLHREMSDAIRRMRLVPIAALAPTWRRCVDETCLTLGRRARLELDLGDVELDKMVLDGLRDPMLHLLRNAVGHGIEPESERLSVGKRPHGTVRVRTRIEEGTIAIDVDDDGRGLDFEKIRGAAHEGMGRSRADVAALTDSAVGDLVFEPGLSTAGAVSAVSGRGVGLDIVRRAAEELGGRISVVQPGTLGGASFRMLVPANILSSRALLVRSGTTTYAIPIDAVERSMRVQRGAIAVAEGREVVHVEDVGPVQIGPIESFVAAVAPRHSNGNALVIVVVVHVRSVLLGLLVDETLGDAEIVIKKLPYNLRSVRGVSGAATLPDGTVALVVDTADLGASPHQRALQKDRPVMSGGRRVLVVDDSVTARAVTRGTLSAAGHEVHGVSDGLQAWEALREGRFDLVVSDVRMPGMDGIELTRKIRAHDALHRIPVVLLTSRSHPEEVQRGLDAGADEYVVKGPSQRQKLLEAVGRHL
jgi:two-component system chemotaxis sensor kinase CheA